VVLSRDFLPSSMMPVTYRAVKADPSKVTQLVTGVPTGAVELYVIDPIRVETEQALSPEFGISLTALGELLRSLRIAAFSSTTYRVCCYADTRNVAEVRAS
jgi:hypothetical protein